jgi:hypothetical protein
MQVHWGRRGLVYYHDLPRIRDGQKFLLHRFLYYFPLGQGHFGGSLAPHVSWVELWERLDPSEALRAQWVERARHELQLQRKILARHPEVAKRELKRVDELLAGELTPPLYLAVTKVVVSEPMPVRGGQKWKLRIYAGTEVEFRQGRPVFYVSEGNHRLLARRKELAWLEECDPPFHREPRGGKLPLVDLRDYQQPDNPLAARAKGAKVPVLSGFLDSPVLLQGFEEAFWRSPELFEGIPFGPRPAGSNPAVFLPSPPQKPPLAKKSSQSR